MTRYTIGTWGQWALLSLATACGGISGLGNNETGGAGSAATPTGGVAATGGAGLSTGGAASTTGVAVTTDGVESSAGGAAATGGVGPSAGGLAATGGSAPATSASSGGDQSGATPYPDDPTLPIDPTCACGASDNICNGSNQCVPRCDESGLCARWLANQPVVDMTIDGTTLYFSEKATVDSEGNPGTDGALYRVGPTDSVPTLIAGQLGNPSKILGRYNGATFIETQAVGSGDIIRVTDSGDVTVIDAKNVTTHGNVVSMWGHWLAYLSADGFKLMGVDLDGALQPSVLYERDDPSGWSGIMSPLVMRDLVLYADFIFNEFCSIQLSDPTQSPNCASHGWSIQSELATSGSQYYESEEMAGISAYSPPSTLLLTLLDADSNVQGFQPGKIVYVDGWLYVNLYDIGTFLSRLARVPTTVVRPPQDILPEAIVTRHLVYASGNSGYLTIDMVFAIGASNVYWVQLPPSGYVNGPQYIFSAPLPPKPCDADLPCLAPLVCTDGYCSAS